MKNILWGFEERIFSDKIQQNAFHFGNKTQKCNKKMNETHFFTLSSRLSEPEPEVLVTIVLGLLILVTVVLILPLLVQGAD